MEAAARRAVLAGVGGTGEIELEVEHMEAWGIVAAAPRSALFTKRRATPRARGGAHRRRRRRRSSVDSDAAAGLPGISGFIVIENRTAMQTERWWRLAILCSLIRVRRPSRFVW